MFCPNGTDWTTVWKDNGISPCFFDSFSSSVMFFAILTLGFVQYRFVKCHGIPVSSRTNNHWPRVYKVQILLTSVMIAESLVQMVLHDLYLTSLLHGYTVLTTLMFISGYLVSLSLLLLEKKYIVFHPGTCYELALLVFWSLGLVRENLAFVSWWSPDWWWQLNKTSQWVMFGLWVLRYAAIFILLVLGFITKTNPAKHVYSLISNNSEEENEEQTHSKRDSESTWSNIRKKIKIMLPIVWPTGRRSLQMVVIFCIGLLVGGRVVNVYLPIYSKKIVNSLTGSGQLVFQWDLIMVYCTLLYLRGAGSSGGLISQIRTQLWLNVQQYTSKCMEIRVFTHLHCLSLRWHLQRKTGEVLRIVDRGTDSMNTLLDQAVFQILPTIIDVVIAIVYFIAAFNYLFGIIIFTCVVIYVVITIVMMEWRTKLRREMNRLDNEANAQAVDSLLNFETVKYYGATEYEISRYQEAITRYQKAEWKSQTFLSIWQATQNSITTVGYLAGLMLCAWAVVHGIGNDTKLTVGDYVLLGSYLTQLFGPLNSLGGYYRIMQKSFIDMENMFELLDKEPEIKDEPDAKDLVVTEGIIEFDNVCFSYEPSRPILKNISFTVLPGQTCALVGHTGSGKSTVIRLLFRFYDIASGAISIDGQNIAKVTQTSLRSSIGVVPQDTVLFNRDIKYNVGYGRVAATDQEIEGAASAADIHERILTFPNKYDTVVGERGLKLSGGEKQRVAIARTLLKAPAIVLLDEATSALDTKTERNIQASLARVCENRTTIIIAHRLSTIIHADQILVLQDGEIIERGKHEELLAENNHYASMWQQQLSRAELDIADEKDKGLQPANHC